MSADVVVVGGGVIGLCAAYHLRLGGAAVTVVDRGDLGRGASYGNAGWVTPAFSGPLPAPGLLAVAVKALLSRDGATRMTPSTLARTAPWLLRFAAHCTPTAYARGLRATSRFAAEAFRDYDELRAGGVDVRLHSGGLVMAFLDAEKAAKTASALRPLAEIGYPAVGVLSGGELRDLEPALSPAVAAGLHLAGERTLDPAQLIEALLHRLREMGVVLRPDSPVVSFARDAGGRVTHVVGPAGRMAADHVVLAAGVQTGPLLAQLGVRLPLVAGKGYSFSAAPAVSPRLPLYLAEAKTAVTPHGERIRVAGALDLVGNDDGVDPRRIESLRRMAWRYLEPWEPAGERQVWSGLRPLTADGLPVIDRLPEAANVVVGTGHGMLGITLGPGSGRALADLVLTGSVTGPAAAFPLRARRQDHRTPPADTARP